MTTQRQEQPEPINQPNTPQWETEFPGKKEGDDIYAQTYASLTSQFPQGEPTNDQLARHSASTVEDKPKRQRPTAMQLTAALALGGALVYGAGSEINKALSPPLTNTVPEKVQPASDEAVEKANKTARELAQGIITILAKPGSGAEAYRGDMVGNKTAVIGPDGKYPSKDDNKNPETFVGFDPVAGEMYFSSTQGYFPNGIKNDEVFESTSVSVTLKVEKGNPIYDAEGQLQIEDYQAAMAEPDTLQLKSMEAKLHAGINPAPEVSIAENEAGILQAVVYENGEYDDYPDKREALLGDKQFDGVTARAEQVAETALEDLQKSAE